MSSLRRLHEHRCSCRLSRCALSYSVIPCPLSLCRRHPFLFFAENGHTPYPVFARSWCATKVTPLRSLSRSFSPFTGSVKYHNGQAF
uniref:Uncharacterized protein n=1 Tax=Leishmania guyanensis TaxID=5670 RepID=A0A1E1J203_LEIGU|nr:Hypothetical protein BN36_3051110 [Leishmania guyanensis]